MPARLSLRLVGRFAIALMMTLLMVGMALPASADTWAQPAAVTMVVNAVTVAAGSTFELSGTVTDENGLPISAAVTLSSPYDGQNFMTVPPEYADHFTTSLRAPTWPQQYVIDLTATAGDGTGTPVSDQVVVTVVPGPITMIDLTAPPSLPVDGSITLTGAVRDAYWNQVSGVPIRLKTTYGDLGSAEVITTEGGTFSTTYTAPSSAGTAEITATTPGSDATASLTLQVWTGTPASLTLVPETPLVGIGSFSSVSLQGKLTDAQGEPIAGATVLLGTTDGFGWINPNQVLTGPDGSYTATFTPGYRVGSATITASVPGTAITASATVQLVVVGTPYQITVAPADPFVVKGDSLVISGKVTDVNGNPNGHAMLLLETTAGSFAQPYVMTGADGTFQAVLTAPDQVGVLEVTAEVAGLPLSESVKVHVTPVEHPEHP